MALAPYFHRSAVAAAQVLSGFDEHAIRTRLEGVTVGVTADPGLVGSREGRALIDMTVRLVARLYPTLSISSTLGAEAAELAQQINPRIDLHEGPADITIFLGAEASAMETDRIYAGCSGWDGTLSRTHAVPVGDSLNPIGAGIAGCLAAAALFRSVFLDDVDLAQSESDQTLSGLELVSRPSLVDASVENASLDADAVLVGAGAIGNAVIWALSKSPLRGTLIVVDPESVELSNIQRYVLARLDDDGSAKVDVAMRFVDSGLQCHAAQQTWQEFVAERGSEWRHVLVALDSARDRRAVQASLPQWIANAWTQPGDLGVSVHPWSDEGACLACLYLPSGEAPSEDKLVAAALGLARPDVEARIRQILWSNGNPPRDLLDEVASALSVPLEDLLPFEGRPLRELYVEGICGGAVLPLNRVGMPAQDVHVPLAPQSALAGVLLAGRLLARSIHSAPLETEVTRIDVLRPLAEFVTQPMRKDPRGICICQDLVYRDAYALKWNEIGRSLPFAV